MENICNWNKCKKIARFKAPLEKDNSKNYKLLCFEHIKEFNKKWNYFEGMSKGEIDFFLKSDMTWHRPTQKFNSRDSFFNILWNNALNDNFEIFKNIKKNKSILNQKLSKKDREAFLALNLSINSNWIAVQKKFKILVKKFHPDMNSGNRIFEEKLKSITIAYNHLKKNFRKK